ncbi:hypothetical protein SKAU_G00237990 [Synaphobranchus kaupii]|uniref:Uncharacterized protein n=1 Tax=Synaphobranchus kaupii TaxID=118154 RepID=A0A9Q1F732_SYNKA|nr:hypothetical protein SKAU_G00237990 [Synaphobranchus kaupii]
MDQEERQKKLEAGRAKLAHFRQRKAKGDGANPQKKTPKRKSAAVHSNDLSTQEHPVVAKACPVDNVPGAMAHTQRRCSGLLWPRCRQSLSRRSFGEMRRPWASVRKARTVGRISSSCKWHSRSATR